MITPSITDHAAPEDLHDARFRDGWDCALAAVALDTARTHQLPATLASVDDVRKVCEAAGLLAGEPVDFEEHWAGVGFDVTAWGTGGFSVASELMTVDGERGVSSSVLWHAIQAARSAS